jgi:hypothetical protein
MLDIIHDVDKGWRIIVGGKEYYFPPTPS